MMNAGGFEVTNQHELPIIYVRQSGTLRLADVYPANPLYEDQPEPLARYGQASSHSVPCACIRAVRE